MPTPTLIGTQTVVNPTTTGIQDNSHVAVLADGRSVVIWRETPSLGLQSIRYQILNGDGTPWSNGNVPGTGSLTPPTTDIFGNSGADDGLSITALSNGSFAVAWEQRNGTGNVDIHYVTSELDPFTNSITNVISGIAHSGVTNFVPYGYTAGDQTHPEIVATSSGFAIVWQDNSTANAGHANGTAIRWAPFFNDGSPDGNGNPVTLSDGYGGDGTPAIAADLLSGSGRVNIVWDDNLGNNAGSGSGIFGVEAAGSGNYRADSTGLHFNIPDNNNPDVAYDGLGNSMVAWAENSNHVFAIVNGNAAVQRHVNQAMTTTQNPVFSLEPTVVGLPQGGFLVLWSDGGLFADGSHAGYDVMGQLYSATGVAIGSNFRVSGGPAAGNISLDSIEAAVFKDGRVLVTWSAEEFGSTTGPEIYRQFVDPRQGALDFSGSSRNDQAYGTNFDDRMSGGRGFDSLFGGLGNDTLDGGDRDDFLDGGAGNDVFVGGLGGDTMTGGAGNDDYTIDALVDVINDGVGEGTADVVSSRYSFRLAADDEIEFLDMANPSGLTSSYLIGNDFAQRITGNNGINNLLGGGGRDTLSGALGNDSLNGGLGNDVLAGGGGNDHFVFNTQITGTPNRDTVSDFSVADDTIDIDNAIFTKLVTAGALNTANFVKNATGVAVDANDYIVYNTTTGVLFYDSTGNLNGSTDAIQFATLNGRPALTFADFVVI